MRRVYWVLTAALLLSAAAGCRVSQKEQAATADPSVTGTIEVFIPCGVARPMQEVRTLFESKYPNAVVKVQEENINTLVHRVSQGEQPDVFVSLGDVEINRLLDEGKLIEDSVTPFAQNGLAVIVPRGNPGGIETIEDFAKPETGLLAFADAEHNSVGFHAKEALEKAGVWDQAKDRVLEEKFPVHVKERVSSGQVNAGIIYGPCFLESQPKGDAAKLQAVQKGRVQFLAEIRQDLYTPFYCTAAIVRGAANERLARLFVEFLVTDEVQEVIGKFALKPIKRRQGSADPLFVHAGAGIRPPLESLAEVFEERTGVPVDFSFKGSGCLLTDIVFSHHGDLYIPGEKYYVDQAAERDFVVDQRTIAYFVPVILVQKGNPKGVRSLADMAKSGVRVGIGNREGVAVGKVAYEMLEKAGLLDKVRKNLKMEALTVQELANAVKLKSLDTAIVWDGIAAMYTDACDAVAIESEHRIITEIILATLSFSENPDSAGEFLEFAASPEGKAIFQQHHYTVERPT